MAFQGEAEENVGDRQKPTHFSEGHNCWRVEDTEHAAIIVDCANYYRALHQAITKARHSIFVVGWDIDSRIELLRGVEARNASLPSRFFDLIKAKTEQNPALHVYLNRWDYSLYMAAEREGLSKIRWTLLSPPNVHYCLDNIHPLGGCHHQKVVVIDDELAFVGGMDVALGRWDYRDHHPKNKKRVDPGGTYEPYTKQVFGPHHDVMFMVTGPIVQALGGLVRERWQRVKGTQPFVNQHVPARVGKTDLWPESVRPDFENVRIAIARTTPEEIGRPAIQEIEQLYLAQIAQAEQFIYMENQYFTRLRIADALNKQLHKKPDLRVLLVSCASPQGIVERKGLWSGRVFFRDHLMKGDVAGRAEMACTVSRENGHEAPIRIHSKVMVVDDKFLHIGSANINNRSMCLDSECDLALQAQNDQQASKISHIRNDLIREHTGLSLETIERFIKNPIKIEKFLNYKSESCQHLQRIDDEKYRYQSFMQLARRLADADRPLFTRG